MLSLSYSSQLTDMLIAIFRRLNLPPTATNQETLKTIPKCDPLSVTASDKLLVGCGAVKAE